jgi:fucose 4-O-acetylase-like acetyltransferase
MKSERLSWIVYARGIAISLVAYRHVFEGAKEAGIGVQQYDFLEYFNILFYSFRMPLFFIISGIFISKNLKKRGLIGPEQFYTRIFSGDSYNFRCK